MRIHWFFICRNLNPLHPMMLCLVEIGPVVLEYRRFFKFDVDNAFFAISLFSPLGKGRSPSFEQSWIPGPSPKDALCQVLLKLVQWFWRRSFLKFMTEFSLFHNYLPLEKVLACHLNKLEPPSPKNALCHVWSKLAQWFWRIRFLNLSMYSRYFVIISPLKRTGPSFTKGRNSKRRRKRWRRRNLRKFCVLLNVEPTVLAYIFTSDSTCDDRHT